MSSDTFVMLYKTLVRSHLEYANCIWSPYIQMDIKKIERVQMRATRMVQQLKNYSYEARIRRLNLPTLQYRRLRSDMFQVFNIVSGKYTTNPTVDFNLSIVFNTRDNIYTMQLTHMHYNLCKQFFTNRIIAVWNSLPNIIINAEQCFFSFDLFISFSFSVSFIIIF